jgi:predicted regulator of Ras-like GTPase activity (Roadblock/LC7/MglB family)
MGMRGNLKDMAIADLIQHTCEDRKTAQLTIQHSGEKVVLYFKNGNVVHAVLGDQTGEAVVYQVLQWDEGSFDLEVGVKPPQTTISRNWSGLLLEGARRLDEENSTTAVLQSEQNFDTEVNPMAKLDDILKEMSAEITGYIACALVGLDGINLAAHASSKAADPEVISAQGTMLLKLVDGSVEKLGSGVLEDNLTTTENAYILMRFLPGKQYYLGLVANRKTGNLGNMRLISKLYADRLSKAMPR